MEAKVLYELTLPADRRGEAPAGFPPWRVALLEEESGGGRVFEKELIRAGMWVHPSRKFRLQVTRERMRKWIQRFKEMLANGLKVPVPFGHSYSPRDNAGFLEELRLVGNALLGRIRIPNLEDAEKVGSTIKDVSLSIDPDFRDGKGKRYGEVIEHVALTNYPVVTAQRDFVAVPMGNERRAYIWQFACEKLEPRSAPDEPEATTSETEVSAEVPGSTSADRNGEGAPGSSGAAAGAASVTVQLDLAHLKESFGLEGELTQVNWLESLKQRFGQLRQETKAANTAVPQSDQDGEQEEELEQKSEETILLEKELERLRLERVEAELALFIRAGRITPAMAAPARKLLSLSDREVIHLTGMDEELEVVAEFRRFLEAIPDHAAVPLDEASLIEVLPSAGGMTEQRAQALAEENRKLAKLASKA